MKLRGGVAEAARSEARGGSARLSGRALRAVDDADASASPTARLRSAFERFAAAKSSLLAWRAERRRRKIARIALIDSQS